MLSPCIECGEPIEGSRCTDHQAVVERTYARASKAPPEARGYDRAWRVLSKRARRLQLWCLDCGSDRDLTADHSPEAWRRRERGLPIRLSDVDVVCRSCNVDRGPARPGGQGSTSSRATLAGEAEFPSGNGSQVGGCR